MTANRAVGHGAVGENLSVQGLQKFLEVPDALLRSTKIGLHECNPSCERVVLDWVACDGALLPLSEGSPS